MVVRLAKEAALCLGAAPWIRRCNSATSSPMRSRQTACCRWARSARWAASPTCGWRRRSINVRLAVAFDRRVAQHLVSANLGDAPADAVDVGAQLVALEEVLHDERRRAGGRDGLAGEVHLFRRLFFGTLLDDGPLRVEEDRRTIRTDVVLGKRRRCRRLVV